MVSAVIGCHCLVRVVCQSASWRLKPWLLRIQPIPMPGVGSELLMLKMTTTKCTPVDRFCSAPLWSGSYLFCSAIIALKNALKADPENIEALLDAGVSFTNEVDGQQAISHLRSWLRFNPRYAAIPGVMDDVEGLRHADG